MAATAFTSVQSRRTLGGPQSQPEPPKKEKKEWPPAVRAYVQKSFQSEYAVHGVTMGEMSAKLKEVISTAADSGQLDMIDWTTLKLPQEMIKEERDRPPGGAQMFPIQRNPFMQPYPEPVPTNLSNNKKRKSSEMADELETSHDVAQPPWKQANSARNVFEDRVTYASPAQAKKMEKRQRKMLNDTIPQETSKFAENLEKRKQRFDLAKTGSFSPRTSSRDDTPDANDGPVVGTCQDLEKNYFRLTSAPKPEAVRPLPVLRKTFELLKKKWRNEANYSYICDQFKSLRQDLTVQHINNSFTVEVYQLHARIALERGDLGEYNQCQTQLRALYKQNLGGNPAEFLAYRILYFIYTCNRTDMNDTLADLTLTDRKHEAVQHALDLRSALASGNYHRFFKLFHDTPNMGGYLIDMFIARERLAALANICKAFKPDVKLRFLTEELGLDGDEDCCAFVCEHGGSELFEERPEGIVFMSGKAGAIFEQAKQAAFRKVDIKGQI